MENEDMMTVLINQASDLAKAATKMRAKYVFDPRPGDLQELFEQDAKEWAEWRKLGMN